MLAFSALFVLAAATAAFASSDSDLSSGHDCGWSRLDKKLLSEVVDRHDNDRTILDAQLAGISDSLRERGATDLTLSATGDRMVYVVKVLRDAVATFAPFLFGSDDDPYPAVVFVTTAEDPVTGYHLFQKTATGDAKLIPVDALRVLPLAPGETLAARNAFVDNVVTAVRAHVSYQQWRVANARFGSWSGLQDTATNIAESNPLKSIIMNQASTDSYKTTVCAFSDHYGIKIGSLTAYMNADDDDSSSI